MTVEHQLSALTRLSGWQLPVNKQCQLSPKVRFQNNWRKESRKQVSNSASPGECAYRCVCMSVCVYTVQVYVCVWLLPLLLARQVDNVPCQPGDERHQDQTDSWLTRLHQRLLASHTQCNHNLYRRSTFSTTTTTKWQSRCRLKLMTIATHNDSSHVSWFFSGVCLSVFPHDILENNAARIRITKLDTDMLHKESWNVNYFGVKRSTVEVTQQTKSEPASMGGFFALLWVLVSSDYECEVDNITQPQTVAFLMLIWSAVFVLAHA